MNTIQTGIISLIKSGITGEKQDLPTSFTMEDAYNEIMRHGIAPLAYTGAVNCGIPKTDAAMQKLFAIYIKQMMRSEAQMAEVDRLLKAFDEAGIDYLSLKGVNMKKLYPKPELRQMGDADILIREEQYGKIQELMPILGFTFKSESDHELVWINDNLYLELHKRLIPSYNKDYYEYYAKGWQLACATEAEPTERHTFKTPEDEFIFLFTHFAKHYRGGGIGLRHITDLWVYKNAYPELNETYITEVLDKLQLLEFYKNISKSITVWFANEPLDEITDFITEYIFSSGNWGSLDVHALSHAVQEGQTSNASKYKKARYILCRAFPDKDFMLSYYPFLKKCPYLYPIFWPVRQLNALMFKRNRVKTYWTTYNDIAKIETFQDSLDYVGLRFNFTRKDINSK